MACGRHRRNIDGACPSFRFYSETVLYRNKQKNGGIPSQNRLNKDNCHQCCGSYSDSDEPRQHVSVGTTHRLVCRYIMRKIPLRLSIYGSRCLRQSCALTVWTRTYERAARKTRSETPECFFQARLLLGHKKRPNKVLRIKLSIDLFQAKAGGSTKTPVCIQTSVPLRGFFGR